MSVSSDFDESSNSRDSLSEIPCAPTAVKTTYHSIELHWGHSTHVLSKSGRPQYHVKEENGGIVYKGYSTHHVFTGLSALTTYKYSVSICTEDQSGPWSTVITVTTDRHLRTSENLHKAINRGDMNSVKSILNDNPNYLNIPDMYGSSPLMSACSQDKNEIVSLLLDMGANIEYCNSSGKTSLMTACYFGNTEGAKLLSSRGASWTTRDLSGFSALHYAVDGGHTSTISYILTKGVNVDDTSDMTLSRWTPLMRTGPLTMSSLCSDSGSSRAFRKNEQDQGAFQEPLGYSICDINQIYHATLGGNVEVAQILVDAGADVNKRDKDGKTPLMLASLNGYKDLVQLLMSNGANSLARNEFGKSAKDFAESFNHWNIAELLEPKEK